MKLYHLLALNILTAAILIGCVNAPYGMSIDRHNFGSTIQQPKTVSLIDATNGQTVWSLDVPVGQTLVVQLHHDTTWTQSEPTGATPAERMRWNLFDTGARFGSLDEEVALSGNPVYLRMDIREPEQPEVRDATFTPVDEPPLPEADLERAPEPDPDNQ